MIYSEPSVEFDRYFHIPLPIIKKHEFGLPLPPRNFPIKFGTNPSTMSFVIMVTHRQTHTHKPTPVKTYSHASRGELVWVALVVMEVKSLRVKCVYAIHGIANKHDVQFIQLTYQTVCLGFIL